MREFDEKSKIEECDVIVVLFGDDINGTIELLKKCEIFALTMNVTIQDSKLSIGHPPRCLPMKDWIEARSIKMIGKCQKQ